MIGSDIAAPAPRLFEQVAVAIGIGGARPTNRTARLAAELADSAQEMVGSREGSLELLVRMADPARAAQAANGIADAYLIDEQETAAGQRRKLDARLLGRIDELKTTAAAARQRLTSLGGVEADPAEQLGVSAAQTALARKRLDAIRAIIASGSPPLSDRREVPSGIETLQSAYLELTRQLAKARETLGERHSTIISLRAETKSAATALASEWRRLEKLAEADLSKARQSEAELRKPETPAVAGRRAAIAEARRNVQMAEEDLARARDLQRRAVPDERVGRVLKRAEVPAIATGFTLLVRLAIAGLSVGASAFLLAYSADRRRRLVRPHVSRPISMPITPAASRDFVSDEERLSKRVRRPVVQVSTGPHRRPRKTALRPAGANNDVEVEFVEPDNDLMHSLGDVLPNIEAIETAPGAIPTLVVATLDSQTATSPAARALALIASEQGFDVLLIEADGCRPRTGSPAGKPVVVDFFGALRAAMMVATPVAALHYAPSLQGGAAMASDLVRRRGVCLVDDLSATYDLIVVDGGMATTSAAAGWNGDAFIRVDAISSSKDDDRFLALFGASTDALWTTILSSAAPSRGEPASARVFSFHGSDTGSRPRQTGSAFAGSRRRVRAA